MDTVANTDTDRRVKQVICEQACLQYAEIQTTQTLADDLGLDSLDLIELVMELEEEFGITIADAEAEACRTVADVTALVDRTIAGN
jgi:acyl carrier protein